MFREWIEALRRRPLLDQMMFEMEEMLDLAVEMYRPTAEVLTDRRKLTGETRDMVYSTDRRINHLQRKIRKQLVEHLVVSDGADVPICLVLMSVTKDAERVGDMCKDLLETAERLGGPLREGHYGRRFTEVLTAAEGLFGPTAEAFRTSDKERGHAAVENARKVARDCDAIIEALLEDDIACRDAVLFTLLARYLKRLCLHLSNIATSVVMPLHRLDYFDEAWDKPKDG
jgi:phosphate transport system protein